jgi:hypothetical protein
MKYTISEFAKQIRDLYPGDYDDLTDDKLTKLWLKKYPKDIDKVDLNKTANTNSSDYFSFSGIIASAFFGYIAYNIYPIAKLGSNAYDYINDDKIVPRILLNTFNNMSQDKFSEFASFFHFWLWVLFLSFVFKAIISLRHAFITPTDNAKIVGTVGVIADSLPLFLFIWKQKTIDDAMPSLIVCFIPSIIGMLFLFNKDDYKTFN